MSNDNQNLRHDEVNIYRREEQYHKHADAHLRCPICGVGISDERNQMNWCAHCGLHYNIITDGDNIKIKRDRMSSLDGREVHYTKEFQESTMKAHKERTCIFCPVLAIDGHPNGPCKHCDNKLGFWDMPYEKLAEYLYHKYFRDRVSLGRLGSDNIKLATLKEFKTAVKTHFENNDKPFYFLGWVRYHDALYEMYITSFCAYNRSEYALITGWKSELYVDYNDKDLERVLKINED